jgi:small multidrug resistance pump
MYYLYLSLAVLFEVTGSSFIKASDGFTKALPTVIVAVAYLICFYFFSLALKGIPLGVAYALWGGLGIALIVASCAIFAQVQTEGSRQATRELSGISG